jgi:hypothetical protein
MSDLLGEPNVKGCLEERIMLKDWEEKRKKDE